MLERNHESRHSSNCFLRTCVHAGWLLATQPQRNRLPAGWENRLLSLWLSSSAGTISSFSVLETSNHVTLMLHCKRMIEISLCWTCRAKLWYPSSVETATASPTRDWWEVQHRTFYDLGVSEKQFSGRKMPVALQFQYLLIIYSNTQKKWTITGTRNITDFLGGMANRLLEAAWKLELWQERSTLHWS